MSLCQWVVLTVAVPENAALARAVPGSRSDLAVGEYVFTSRRARTTKA